MVGGAAKSSTSSKIRLRWKENMREKPAYSMELLRRLKNGHRQFHHLQNFKCDLEAGNKQTLKRIWSAYTHCWRLLVSTRTDVSVRNDHEPYIKFLNQWMFWNFTEMVSKNVKADLFWSSLAFITSHGPVNGLPENEPATYPYINLTYIQLAWHTTKTRGKLLVSGRA